MSPFNQTDPSDLILQKLTAASISAADRQQLATQLLTDSWQRQLIDASLTSPNLPGSNLTGSNLTIEQAIEQAIDRRIAIWQQVYPALVQFCQTRLGWPTCPAHLLWKLWLPLAEQIVSWQHGLNRPLIQGILGIQGTGKTTLTLILSQILQQQGVQTCTLSIDDLYKTYADRQALQQIDPRFRWRGPPGTHDIDLGLQVLDQLRSGQPVAMPRFDKSAHQGAGDRTQFEVIDRADIVLFEGWFVGVRPIDPQAFAAAPDPICTAADRDFAREVNRRLQDYLPLWERLDRLIVLYPSHYQLSQQWRRQAEQQMRDAGRSGMSDSEIDQFVTYFWRALHPELFVKPLLQSGEADLAIELNADHDPVSISAL